MPPRTAMYIRRPGPVAVPTDSVPPAGTSTGFHMPTGTPSTLTSAVAPVMQTTDAAENRNTGPAAVDSSAGAPAGLPTARLASCRETASIGPLGGTPTCQKPTRPRQSCTVVMMPGATTSMRGSGSTVTSSVDVECVAPR